MNTAALSVDAFETKYQGGRDPWSFAQSPYELSRYATLIDCLRPMGYDTVYEPGCAVGVLTAQLAGHARHVIASDFAPSAVVQAQARCAALANVEVVCADVGTFVPEAALDLIVFSEIGYYFTAPVLAQLVDRLSDRLVAGGEFLAGHWLGHSDDHVLHGDQVHEVLQASPRLRATYSGRYTGFRVDAFVRT